eukprot:15037839-Heterocapsa_arctica.AAC.1
MSLSPRPSWLKRPHGAHLAQRLSGIKRSPGSKALLAQRPSLLKGSPCNILAQSSSGSEASLAQRPSWLKGPPGPKALWLKGSPGSKALLAQRPS